MTDLDRLLELRAIIYTNYDFNTKEKQEEYQSLYEKISKAEEFYTHDFIEIDLLRQNQKTPEDIEKIQKYNSVVESMYNLSGKTITLSEIDEIIAKENAKEQEIKQLKEELKYKIQELRINQQYFHEECDSHEITKQELATLKSKIGEIINNPRYADYGSQSFYYIEPQDVSQLLEQK